MGAWVLLALGVVAITNCSDQKESGTACDAGKVTCGGPCATTDDCPVGTHCNNQAQCWADCLKGDSRCGEGQTCGPMGYCSGEGIDLPPDQVQFDDTHDGGVEALTPEKRQEIEDAACAGESRELESIPAVLEIVVDTSYSMAEMHVDGTVWNLNGSGATKWQITREALGGAIDSLGALVAVGIVFYPNHEIYRGETITEPQDPSACFDPSSAVPVATLGPTGSPQRQAIAAGLNAVSPNGNTPTHDAYRYGLESGLRQAPADLQGQRYMLLLTDGVPTFAQGCVGTGQETPPPVPTDPIVQEVVGAYQEDGTKTFIIGSPGSQDGVEGSDARPWLSQAAEAGQTAAAGCQTGGPNYCHMDMTQSDDFAASLKAGLGTVASQLGECTYRQPTPREGETIDADTMRVIVTIGNESEIVWPDNQGSCDEGWQLIEGKIVLCKATCDRAKSDPTTVIEVVAGCQDDVISEILE